MAKTRTHTPQPLAPMLEESFSTAVENRVAELNNLLAREGRTTSDPMALALRGIRVALRDFGVTFERRVIAPVTAAVAPKTAAPTTTKVAATPAAPTGKARKARTIKEDQIVTLQMAGTISEAAPYGCDDTGRPLAPYGVKNDGVPMKRRGRTAAPSAPAPAARASAPVAEATAEATSEEVSEESAEPASGETAVDENDLDGLLAGL
jgi:hypothetical protein